MLNREDVRKILEARLRVIQNIRNEDRDVEDISMKDMFDLILGEIKKQENFDKVRE